MNPGRNDCADHGSTTVVQLKCDKVLRIDPTICPGRERLQKGGLVWDEGTRLKVEKKVCTRSSSPMVPGFFVIIPKMLYYIYIYMKLFLELIIDLSYKVYDV